MTKNEAAAKIAITHDRHRADGPKDTFDWFVDAPRGWCFVEGDGGRYHFYRYESGSQAELSEETLRDEIEPCKCGCAKEAV